MLNLDLFPENLIYWTDAKLHRIEVSDYLGLTRRTLTPLDETNNLVGIAFSAFDNSIYWSDWMTGSISRLEIQQGSTEEGNVQGSEVFEDVRLALPNSMHAFSKASEVSGKCTNGESTAPITLQLRVD